MTEPRGNIYLINRAPLDLTYQHTIDFKTAEEQLSFWRSLVKYTLNNYSYVRRERRFINVDKSFESLEAINYLFFQSRGDSKYYYCFVTDREYINDETTRLYFEIDVLQSFMFDYTFKPSFISQGHVDRWNAELKPIYSRTDEGLNYGSEYLNEAAYKIKPDDNVKHGFYLIFCKDHSELVAEGAASEPTRYNKAPTPYCIYITPNTEDDTTSSGVLQLDNVVTYPTSTGDYQSASISNIRHFFDFMGKSAFGDFVQQIVYVPYLPFKYTISDEELIGGIKNYVFLEGSFMPTTISQEDTTPITLLKIQDLTNINSARKFAEMDIFNGLDTAIPSAEMWEALRANPYKTERDRRFESKLLCFPYRYNIFTDWRSAPALIKNEYLCGDKITINESSSFGFNTPRRYSIANYRKDIEGREASITQSLPLEQTVFNDAYYTYILQNKNQISANLTTALISAGTGTITGAISGATTGAIGGAYGAAAGAIVGAAAGTIKGIIDVSTVIRQENAKQADLKNLPDTILNSSDCSFAILDDTKYLTFYRKAISCDFMEQLAQYWHMFGYVVRRVDTPNTRSRLRYNYIKTVGANIEGGIESQYLQQIKAIYDNGVTIWHYSNENFFPLDYTYENPERNLLNL